MEGPARLHACQAKDMMQLWHVKLLVPDSENDRISKMPQLLLRGSAILKIQNIHHVQQVGVTFYG